jgi:methyltransferase-like protein
MDDSPQYFTAPNGGSMMLDDVASKLAVQALMRAWPHTLSFDALLAAVQSVPGDVEARLIELIEKIVTAGMGRFRVTPVARQAPNPFLPEAARTYPAELPKEQVSHTFNVWNQSIALDAFGRFVVPLLDGTHTRDELLAYLERASFDGTMKAPKHLQAEFDRLLKELCA